MDRIFNNFEQWRMITVTTISPLLGYFTPTRGFVFALVMMFGFNIWAGMRADGITLVRCRNFSFKKFWRALAELFLYLLIVELIFSVMTSCGDTGAALVAIKSLTYVFMYVYGQNAFKNLIIVYPRNMALRIIYHVIRLEFRRAAPSHVRSVLDRLEGEIAKNETVTEKI